MSDLELEYLTNDAELVELCRVYWETDSEFNFIHTVSHVAREFDLSVRDVSKIVLQNSVARSITQKCERCGKAHSYTSRSDYQQKHNRQFSRACDECNKIEREEARQEYQREQERINAVRLAQLEQQRQIIKDTFTLVESNSLDAKSLSLESAVYLLSLIRLGASEDFAYIEPVQSLTENLAPTEKYTYHIVTHLHNQGLILPHSDSSPNAFEFEDGKIKSYYPSRVIWSLPFGKDYDEKKSLISDLERIFKDKDWPDGWHHEWQPLWKTIAIPRMP